MADSLLLGREAAFSVDTPRLAGGTNVLDLAYIGDASGYVTVDKASRQDDGHKPETHENYLNVAAGFASMGETIRLWRRTTVGKIATLFAVGSAALLPAACGSDADPTVRPPAASASAPGTTGGEQNGHLVAGGERVIIGDPECYDGFGKLSAEGQAECVDDFNQFTMDQVKRLSPLDQARWAVGYRDVIAGHEGSSSERLPWSSMIKNETARGAFANLLQQTYVHDVVRVAWLMQQQETSSKALSTDERTWAALFGVGTTADSQPITDAKALAEKFHAASSSYNDYLRLITLRTQLFASPAENIAVDEKKGTYTMTFSATHKSGSTMTFTYRFYPYLMSDTDADGNAIYREFTNNDEVRILQGKPLIAAPIVGNI